MYARLLRNSCLFNIKHEKRFSDFVQEQTWSDKLADAVTPLWRIPYSEQLELKNQRNFTIIKKLSQKLRRNSKNPHGLICQLLDTIPSVII